MTQPNRIISSHLSEEEFGELLSRFQQSANVAADSQSTATEAHLASCPVCAAELGSLRDSLSLYREASTAYAENQLRSMPRRPVSAQRPMLHPAYWAAAAAAIVVAFALPTQWNRPVSAPAPIATSASNHTTESDEALLEDVNQELSESIPTPMRALADPTAATTTSIQNSTQRKD